MYPMWFVFGGVMSSTLSRILLLSLLAAPVKSLAFDFDKELAKQNNVSLEIVTKKGSSAEAASKSTDKNLKVTLIAKK